MELEPDFWIPIVMFVVIGLISYAFFVYRYKTRHDLQNTVRAAIDKGQELTPEVLERLGRPRPLPEADLRRGVVLAALGVAVAVFGFTLDDPDAMRPLLAIGAFPVIVGIAYLGLWRFNGRT